MPSAASSAMKDRTGSTMVSSSLTTTQHSTEAATTRILVGSEILVMSRISVTIAP